MIEFAKEDIEIRIDSMKLELDKLCQTLTNQLLFFKNELIQQTEIERNKYEEILQDLTKNIEK